MDRPKVDAHQQIEDLTAIIACKNRDRNLRYCLSSIESCTPRPRVVVVDFGSDKNQEYLQDMFGSWLSVIRVESRTTVFHKARALNIAIKQVESKFSCSTDCDQVYSPNFFGVVRNQLTRAQKRMILCKSYFLKQIPEWFSEQTVRSKYQAALKLAMAGKRPHGEGCCTALPTKWIQKVGGWDEAYVGYGAEDSDIILRAKLCGFAPTYINSLASTVHLPHEKTGSYYNKSALEKNRKLYNVRKHTKRIVANSGKEWGAME